MPFREVIVLREFNGLSYREIAEVVAVPVATVMSCLADARAILLAARKTTIGPAPSLPVIPAGGSMRASDYADTIIISD